MNRVDVYQRTVESLRSNLMNKKIQKGYPCSCPTAVVIADANNIKTVRNNNKSGCTWENDFPYWATLFYPDVAEEVVGQDFETLATNQITSTGYTVEEIDALDAAAESAEDLGNSIMNFLRVLHKIHEIPSQSYTVQKTRKTISCLV